MLLGSSWQAGVTQPYLGSALRDGEAQTQHLLVRASQVCEGPAGNEEQV